MTRIVFGIFIVATLSGCIQVHRINAFANVTDYGPVIATKYKYAISEYRMPRQCHVKGHPSGGWVSSSSDERGCCSYGTRADSAKWQLERLKERAYALQPDVFAENGIHVAVSQRHGSWHNEFAFMTPLLFLGTLGIIPCIEYTSQTNAISVQIAKLGVQSPTVDYGYERKLATGGLIIPSLGGAVCKLMWDDIPDEVKREDEYRDQELSAMIMGEQHFCADDRAEPYAIAALLKKMEDSGEIDAAIARIAAQKREAVRRRKAEEDARRVKAMVEAEKARVQLESKAAMQKMQGFVSKPPYKLIDLVREEGSDFAYAFALELSDNPSIQTFFGVQNVFANEVRTAYMMENPNADPSALRVVVQPRMSNGRIVGRAEVLTITPVALGYDHGTRLGKLSVRFNANQYEEARKWVRRNVETLARDKNIALVTGEIPPAARFYLLGESLKDGNILEIEFKTE